MAEDNMNKPTHDTAEPLAIVGSSCRFPGSANSPSELWNLLQNPVDLVTEIPESRFNTTGFYHENGEHPGTTNVKKAYLLTEEPWRFDNEFFNISTAEALAMDPQQRIILEVVYEAIESAGYSMSQLKGSSTGVFVGQMSDDYSQVLLRDLNSHPQHAVTGSARSILANRISYFFDWNGPSLNVDTACSSSLVALHLAVQSVRTGECEMAVVAGVNLILAPELFSYLTSFGMLSPDGLSRMWDTEANGYARGDGFAVIVIKSLKKAEFDGDDIESVIRNTGVNHDGSSTGLTVPSTAAQAELITSTYNKVGLDVLKEEDRCQFFECHGTGTKAGDPREAEAISRTFFPNRYQNGSDVQGARQKKLHVGSIKTVIGHLEGTAGLAGLLKASLAVQHGLIPPNLHFKKLNPAIVPFYTSLEIPATLQPWPNLAAGIPRRASINSFGFGGANAHAIIENWENPVISETNDSSVPCWGPFTLSAHSESALTAMITSLSAALKTSNIVHANDIASLAWTLQARRTHFSYRASFTASNKKDLITRLESAVQEKEEKPIAKKATKISNVRVLGIFTGQGAQWPSMGSNLLLYSATFRRTIKNLDLALNGIPDGPTWSLADELMQKNDPIRIASAEISQPLCTALQIGLVDLLKESGISFEAVVGHSSGEIAAAYAAGILTADDAIRIAYYRGFHLSQARRDNTRPGKMMAVGMAPQDADSFCRQERFLGRIVVAAKNSHSSVTLSGDADAIEEAKEMLESKSIFARKLLVDTAYHSFHMNPVREPYLASLKNLDIKPGRNCFEGTCNWYSSVYGIHDGKSMSTAISFEHEYWVDNMTRPVLFSNAIESALRSEHIDLTLEVGPHPALRGPATECIQEVAGRSLPYQGVIERNKNELETFSNTLGFVWKNIDLAGSLIDFAGFRRACIGQDWKMPRVLKGLPTYPWDHDRLMLKESKISKTWRTRKTPFHELLGYPDVDSSKHNKEVRWRNVLRVGDVEWLQGHQFQNQVLLPAAGYLAMAVNAALHLVGYDQSVQLVELKDIVIHSGVSLEEGPDGVDMNLVIRVIKETSTSKTAEISCRCSNTDAASTDFDKEVFTGRVLVVFGESTDNLLPDRVPSKLPLTDVANDRFYFWLQKIGLRYSDPFLLDSIKRRRNQATVTTTPVITDQYVVHPGTLDSIIHSIIAAFAYPGDGRLWTTYLPKSFKRVCFDVNMCRQTRFRTNRQLVADAYLTEGSARAVCADMNVFFAEDHHAAIQFQGAVMESLEAPAVGNDQVMIWNNVWKKDILSAIATAEEVTHPPTEQDRKLHEMCERTAYFYLRQLCEEISTQEVASMDENFQSLVRWSLAYLERASQNPSWNPSWEVDTLDSLTQLIDQSYEGQIDLEIMSHFGRRIPSIVRGSVPALETLEEGGRLEKLHTEGLSVVQTNNHLSALLDHLSHQFPRMRVLEIGANTGATTAVALEALESKLEDYTFTDPSTALLLGAQTRFAKDTKFMTFQVLDIEQPPGEQGFKEQTYDIVIASKTLHETKSVSQAIQHCRQLLRPGGFLILIEPVNQTTLRIPFLFSRLPTWWGGDQDDKSQGPTLTEAQWDLALRENLFSGVDCALQDFEDESMHTFSTMLSQAVDDRINVLRDPLRQASGLIRVEELLIIGGRTLAISKMAMNIKTLLSQFAEHTTVIKELDDVPENLKYGSAVICISGLEEAAFSKIDQHRLSVIQSIFRQAKYVLWVTKGCRDDDPYANMIVGIGRSVCREMEHLRLKLVDVNHVQSQKHQPDAIMFSEMLLQTICLELPGYNDVAWGDEPEVAVENGAILIPRVIPNIDLNTRFNSARRRITKSVSPTLNTIQICLEGDGITLEEKGSNDKQGLSDKFSLLPVLSSSLCRFTCLDDGRPFYICLGNGSAGKKPNVLAISETNASAITMDLNSTLAYKGDGVADEQLSAILTMLLCDSLLSNSTGTTWIHDADDGFAEVLFNLASQKGVSIFFTTSNRASIQISKERAVYIHPRASSRERKSLLPPNIKRCLYLGANVDALAELSTLFRESKLRVEQGIYNHNLKEAIPLPYSRSSLIKMLWNYCSQPELLHNLGCSVTGTTVKADLLHEQSELTMSTSIVSWSDIPSIQAQVMPATTEQLFTAQKTYFLIGLTGDVGLSLCEFMIEHGAKYLAIASRNPKVHPEICKLFESKGATVRIFSLDIADMESLKAVHQEIVSTMPPFGGVANAAMVVRDHPFDGSSFEDVKAVFGPKVRGTENLDKLFFSTPLEFFIPFSSISSIVGNGAQSIYAAANLFMSTLVMRRRKRGLAASIMHFGMLLGMGFIQEVAGEELEEVFRRNGMLAIPEPDFHAIFAQTILSGRLESDLNPEIINGIANDMDTSWTTVPRFWHCRKKDDERIVDDKQHNQGRSAQSIQDQLKAAVDSAQALSILEGAIVGRVSLALGSSGEDIDRHVSLISLGFDSLAAVRIRSWFLKVLDVDVPVLKFLGGSSLDNICEDVLKKLPQSLTPWIDIKEGDQKLCHDEPNVIGPTASTLTSRVAIETADVEDDDSSDNKSISGISPQTTISEETSEDLEPVKYERIGDMSRAQAELYFLHEYLRGNAYNIAYSGSFHGRLDMQKLKSALQEVGTRHEALRSAYFIDISTSRPVQAVLPEPCIVLNHIPSCEEDQLQIEMATVKSTRFEIEKGVVMKLTVMTHSPALHSMLFSHHHIALDGIGWSVFIADLSRAYARRLGSTPASGIQQSIDMAKRQLAASTAENLHADLAFWKDVYRTIPAPLPLFSFAKVNTRPAVQDYEIDSTGIELSSALKKLVYKAAFKIGVTPFHFYTASLATFLSCCLGVDDVAIGVVDAGRTEAEDMGTIGYFLNVLPVRIQLKNSEKFEEVAKRARDEVLMALAHAQPRLEMILGSDGLGLQRSSSENPLFQVAINYRKAALAETDFGSDGKIQWTGAVPGGNPYDLFVNIAETTDRAYVSLITQRSLYEASDGALLLKWYTRALEGLARDTCIEVGKCPISNEADILEALQLGRGSEVKVPWKGTLTDRIDEVANDMSSCIAIKDEQTQDLTYAQMTARVSQIMRQLQDVATTLSPGSNVATLLDPVADAICCILAVLRLGLVWIPLDTRNHSQRLGAVVEESRPRVLICHEATRALAIEIGVDMALTKVVSIDGDENNHVENDNRIVVQHSSVESKGDRSSQPAMILYTSGSTGIPKGVILTHGALVNQIWGTITTLSLKRETTLQQSPLGFDLMLDQIFLALCNGGTIVMVGVTARGDPTKMAELMVRHNVTLTHLVPSEYSTLLNYGHHILARTRSWRYAMSGGEKLSIKIRKAFHKLNCDNLKLVNVYGPAEITLACARGIVPYRDLAEGNDDSSDHLRPSPNYGLEVVDADMKSLPLGFPGEICITGQGVGLGYLNRPEESSRKFTQRNTSSGSTSIIRAYRSGDKGRILPDGTLQVLGRLDGDRQVKIHGIRVELDEIANAIIHMSEGAIVNAAASLRSGQPPDTLVAFIVFDVGYSGDKSQFIEWLQSTLPLPPIMKPRFIIATNRLPATANGKIDRTAVDMLPIPNGMISTSAGSDGLNPQEQLMADVWTEVLSTRTLRNSHQQVFQSDTDFFQSGGSSILMIKLKTLLQIHFGVTPSLPELFQASTLKSMTTLVSEATNANKKVASTKARFLGNTDSKSMTNWNLEIASMLDGLPQPKSISSLPRNFLNGGVGLEVILTGATGFIGKHLLMQLIQNPRVAKVHCIAIRPDAGGKLRHLPIENDKIVEYSGDLWTLNLGLSASQFEYLAENVDVIIHNGADVSLLKTYQTLRRTNVVSTRTLSELAIPRRIPLHFVSTASVAKVLNDKKRLLEVPASPADPELLNSVDGYAATKWASEMLLEKVAIDNELPTFVHRLAHVIGDDASELDAVGMLLKYSLLMRAIPQFGPDSFVGQWDFVMVENIVKDIVESAVESATGGPSTNQNQQSVKATFINHTNDTKISHENLKEYLEGVAGQSLRVIDMKEWLADASEKGLHSLVYEFYYAFLGGHGKMVLPVMEKGV